MMPALGARQTMDSEAFIMFVVVAEFYAREGCDGEVAESLRRMTTASRAEPGCLMYTVNRSLEDSRKFVLYEQYRTRDDHKAHRETIAYKEYVAGRVLTLLERRLAGFYELLGAE